LGPIAGREKLLRCRSADVRLIQAWFLLLAIAFSASNLHAQNPVRQPHPLVERLSFEGVTSVSKRELQRTLSTEATRCRTFLLQPFCAISNSSIFEIKRYLDREQLSRDVLRIAVFYWLRGFRQVAIDTTVTARGRGVAVTFNVTEGAPTLISTVSLQQTRDILSERQLRRWGLPSEGDRIDLTRLDSLEVRARRALWDRGYGNAFVRDTAQPVDSLRVALNVLIDTGPVTTVDTVLVEGNERVSSLTVRRLVGLRRGDLYKRAELLDAQRRVYRSDLFRQTMISTPDSADSVKTVLVNVREAPLRAVQLGVGFNTVEFGQIQANLTLYNFMGTARRVELHSALGNLFARGLYGKSVFGSAAPAGVEEDVDDVFFTPTWQLSASVTQPWLFTRRNSLGLTVFSNRRSVPNIVIDRGAGASFTFTRAMARDIPVSFTYRYERARIEAGDLYFCANFGYCAQATIQALQQTNSLSPFVLSLRADRTDDPLQPRRGYTARLDFQHASAASGSAWRYNRIEAELTPYIRLGRNGLVVRMHAGRVSALAGTNAALGIDAAGVRLLHPRSRFFGGGARSVRGYAEGQLGPRVLTIDPAHLTDTTRTGACTLATIESGACDPNVAPARDFVPRPVGGNSLLEGTIEYRFPLARNIGGAIFVDAASVGGSELGAMLRGQSAVTPGIGFRYSSPIGPVRVDLGIRPKRIEELPVVTQVRDPDGRLRLVELTTPKRYDPTEGPHGFLGGVISRLQLHLYIGEAY
jgi:outer membrane protein assembly factor BamA